MPTALETFLDTIEGCDTLDELDRAVAGLRGIFQVDHAVYHSINRNGTPYALNTYSEDWGSYYLSETLYRIDPVVRGAFQRFHPYDWKTLDWGSRQSRRFLSDAIEGGVGNQGISVPIRGPQGEFALFTLSHRCTDRRWQSFLAAHRGDLLLFGHFLHQAVRRIECAGRDCFAGPGLSPRESEVLQLLAGGLNRSRVAERLKISEHTLRVYVESARFKLGAANTTHAVARAVSHGLIAL